MRCGLLQIQLFFKTTVTEVTPLLLATRHSMVRTQIDYHVEGQRSDIGNYSRTESQTVALTFGIPSAKASDTPRPVARDRLRGHTI